ncbi:MAG: hypothetical protein C4558_05535, partial [Dehalococcoidia bacterium]
MRRFPVLFAVALGITALLSASCGEPEDFPGSFPHASGDPAKAEWSEDYGAFVIFEDAAGRLWRQEKPLNAREPATSPRDASYLQRILLANGVEQTILPKIDALDLTPDPSVRLLHVRGPVPAGFVDELNRSGLTLLNAIPHSAYAVWGDESGVKQAMVQRRARIDTLRDWRREDKRPQTWAISQGPMDAAVFIVDHPADTATKRELQDAALKTYSPPVDMGPYTVYRVQLDADALERLLDRSDVYWAEPYGLPRPCDERQGMIMAGKNDGSVPTGPGYQAWLDGLGLDRLGEVGVDIADTGCDRGTPETVAHPDLAGRIVAILNFTGQPNGFDQDGHGTINAAIVGGVVPDVGATGTLDDAGYLYGLGIAPGVSLVCSKNMHLNMWASTQSYTKMATAVYAAGARISSNSWGFSGMGSAYDAGAQEYDGIVRDADRDPANGLQPIAMVFAAGNEGEGEIFVPEALSSLRSPGVAKNVITVGASENWRMTGAADGCDIPDAGADNARDLINFSSRGPTADDRFKPDIVAPGTHITGAASSDPAYTGGGVCNGYMPEGQTRYAWSSGTSHATPAVAGAAALVHAWRLQQADAEPSPALLKAILALHAVDMAGGNNGFDKPLEPIPSIRQGWGRMDLATIFDGAPRLVLDQSELFTASGQEHVVRWLRVARRDLPVKIALAWTDAPGATMGASYCNDLDLIVSAGAGAEYRGNFLYGGVSQPTDVADPRNNLELVILPPGKTLHVSVRVVAVNLTADGVPGDASAVDQDFALYAYNVIQGEACTADEDCADETDCTRDACVVESGDCLSLPDAALCDDGNPCSEDACRIGEGCAHEELNATPCEDGSFCTFDDICARGECVGFANTCDDEIDCTADSCDETAQACVHEPQDSRCAPGNVCDAGRGCLESPDGDGDAEQAADGDHDTTGESPLPDGDMMTDADDDPDAETAADGDRERGSGITPPADQDEGSDGCQTPPAASGLGLLLLAFGLRRRRRSDIKCVSGKAFARPTKLNLKKRPWRCAMPGACDRHVFTPHACRKLQAWHAQADHTPDKRWRGRLLQRSLGRAGS